MKDVRGAEAMMTISKLMNKRKCCPSSASSVFGVLWHGKPAPWRLSRTFFVRLGYVGRNLTFVHDGQERERKVPTLRTLLILDQPSACCCTEGRLRCHGICLLLYDSEDLSELPEFGPLPNEHFKIFPSANHLVTKFLGSGLPGDFVQSLVEAIVGWSTSAFLDLNASNRQCVLYYLGLSSERGPGLINNITQPKIRNMLLPVLVLDNLLHASHPDSTAVRKARNPDRPPSHYKHRDHFLKNNKWHEVLTKAAKIHEEGKRITSNAEEQCERFGVRQECIQSLSALNTLSVPGDVAVYNVTQAAFMLRAIQRGVMELNAENIIDLALSTKTLSIESDSHAQEQDASISRHEVQGVLRNPNLLGIPATLAVAVAVSPIYLLTGQNYAKSVYNPGTSIYHTWLASGNAHILDLDHPLGNLHRLFWVLLPKVSCGQLLPRDAVTQIFASPEMKVALEGQHSPATLAALVYVSDEDLHTLAEPEDAETERQMANYLELTRKQVQEQEAQLKGENRKLTGGGYSSGGGGYHFSGIHRAVRRSRSKSLSPKIPDTNKEPSSVKTRSLRESRTLRNLVILRAFLAFCVFGLRCLKRARKCKHLGVFHELISARPKLKQIPKDVQDPQPENNPQPETEENGAEKDGKEDKARKIKQKKVPERSTRKLRSSTKTNPGQTNPPIPAVVYAKRRKGKKPSSTAPDVNVEGTNVEKPHAHYINLDNSVQRLQPEQRSLQSGPFFKWKAHRPVHPHPMDLVVYAPGTERRDFISDREMLKAMFASQPTGSDDLPLFLQDSARDPDPKLQASATQSVFFVCTEHEYNALPFSTKHQIHRHRCVILVDVYVQDPSPPFDHETMQEFRDPDALCSIQDMGLDGVEADECVLAGPLSALLPDPDRPVLNAVHHPLPHHRLPTPPGLSTFCSLSPSLTFLEGHEYLPAVHSPWGDRQWALWATEMARTAIHTDIAGTEMTVITGSKMIAIGSPRTDMFRATGYQADLGSRYMLMRWDHVQETGGTDIYRWEIFLLRPNMVFYMRAGTPHFVISLQDTIAHGLHSINAAQIQPTVFNILHNFISEGSFANAEHRPIQSLLIRMFIYWVEVLLREPPLSTRHAPDLYTEEGLLDLLTLYSYVVLYPALLLDGYRKTAASNTELGVPTVMPPDQYREYMLALHYAVVLNKWMDTEHVIGDNQTRKKRLELSETIRSFDWLCDVSITHMAACLAQYRTDWVARTKSQNSGLSANFTAATLKQQLRRSFCGYLSVWDNTSERLHDKFWPLPIRLGPNVLSQIFETKVQGPSITHFMPWDLLSRGMPYFVQKKKGTDLLAVNKRPSSPGEEVPRKRARIQ
ncbi:hypothetical protein R3P38DRAFT_2770628 [Favolaschia claudopus]|uniref:JmjC domain-containing protein n=1 Tax=Favolaschia claudopus TaxID=2862362 RepID=A0AAW0CHC1_9AGAR